MALVDSQVGLSRARQHLQKAGSHMGDFYTRSAEEPPFVYRRKPASEVRAIFPQVLQSATDLSPELGHRLNKGIPLAEPVDQYAPTVVITPQGLESRSPVTWKDTRTGEEFTPIRDLDEGEYVILFSAAMRRLDEVQQGIEATQPR